MSGENANVVVDVVNDAFSYFAHHLPGTAKPEEIEWNVRLVGESEVRTGTIEVIGVQTYLLRNPRWMLFFAADKVLFISPKTGA